ncbi:hypothetical protein D3C76_156580 [compost metagenome]
MESHVCPLDQQRCKPVDMARMMNKIAVQRPYFAFETLYQTASPEWDIWGDFVPEQPLGLEVGPLAIAEAGRHLAILGSCAVAMPQASDERIYYLAIRAVWVREALLAQMTPRLTARARVVERTQKRARASTELLFDGKLIGVLEVEYQILSEKMFDTLFGNYREDQCPAVAVSPFRKALDLKPAFIKRHAAIARSLAGTSAPSAGHFPHYPMWPVALVMYGLTQVFAALLEKRLKRPFLFKVLEAQVQAHRLVSAHEQLTFYAGLKSLSRNRKRCRVCCRVSLGLKPIASLKVMLAIEERVGDQAQRPNTTSAATPSPTAIEQPPSDSAARPCRYQPSCPS